MARKKDSIALFEAISKSRDKQGAPTGTPAWMGSQSQPAQPPHEDAAPPALPSGASRRVQFSLSLPAAVAAGAAMVALLAGAFALGMHSAGPKAPVAEEPPEAPAPVWSPQAPGPGPGTPAPDGRIKGKYYLVIERLKDDQPGDKAEAERIVKFLADHGEQATAELAGKTRRFYAIWSMRPFDEPDGQAAKDFALSIEKLGAEYLKAHGTYKFQQRTAPSAPLTPLYWKQD